MSESIAFTAGSVVIYGTLAAAREYLGPERDEWDLGADSDITADMRRAFVKAKRFLDGLSWAEGYQTFADRDAVEAIQQASYELAALLYEDPDVLASDDLRGVTSISAGGDSVSLALGVTSPSVPGRALALVGPYLAESTAYDATDSQAGCTVNPFSLGEDPCEC